MATSNMDEFGTALDDAVEALMKLADALGAYDPLRRPVLVALGAIAVRQHCEAVGSEGLRDAS
jgi:hypothetical protein